MAAPSLSATGQVRASAPAPPLHQLAARMRYQPKPTLHRSEQPRHWRADRTGIRIAIVRGHAMDSALKTKNAERIYADVPDAAFELLRANRADVLAETDTSRAVLHPAPPPAGHRPG